MSQVLQERQAYHTWAKRDDLFIVAADRNGLSCQEVAHILGVTVESVYMRRHLLRQQGFFDNALNVVPVTCAGCPHFHAYFGASGGWCWLKKSKVAPEWLICVQRQKELNGGDGP